MARMVGWASFAIEHVMFGLVLGAFALHRGSAVEPAGTPTEARSAILSS
jgi:hypothetical protein